MNSLQRQSYELLFLIKVAIFLFSPLLLIPGSCAFQPAPITTSTTTRLNRINNHVRGGQMRRTTPLLAMLDPSEWANHAAAAMAHHHHIDTTSSSSFEAILSTMYTATMDGMQVGQQQAADSSSASLEAGRTVVPNLQNMVDSVTTSAADHAKQPQQQCAPDQVLQKAISPNGGWLAEMRDYKTGPSPLDCTDYKIVKTTAGFHETRGILPKATMADVPRGTPGIFIGQVLDATSMLNVVNKLPFAAIFYALVDLLFLRPGIDLYKEDIEEEPADALAEILAVSTVRMGAFALIAFVMLVLFNRL